MMADGKKISLKTRTTSIIAIMILLSSTIVQTAPVNSQIANVSTPVITTMSQITNTPPLSISGTADANVTINVYSGSTLVGSTASSYNSNWNSFILPLAEGINIITATATDSRGNVSTPSASITITVDTTAPTVAITSPANNTQVNNNRPTMQGTSSDSGSGVQKVQIKIDGNTYTSATGTTAWSYTPSAALSPGSHIIMTQATDNAGNLATTSIKFTVDTTPPAAPVITNSSFTTNKYTPKIVGRAEIGSTVKLFDNKTQIGSATATGGTWSIITLPLSNGTHIMQANATDAAGNTGPNSASITVTVDTTAPTVAITSLTNNAQVNNNQPTIQGTSSDSGSGVQKVQVRIDSNTYTSASGTTSWSYTPSTISSGSHTLTALATDNAKNTATTSIKFTVDTTPPAAPVITNSSFTTNISTPLIVGTAEIGSTVKLFDNKTQIGSATATGGTWSIITLPLSNGTHIMQANATDAAGNTGPNSASITVTIGTPSCSVSIAALPIYNVGQEVLLNATVTGISNPTYQWTVNGTIIKDYQELTSAPWSTTPMGTTDFQKGSISFYWLPDPSQIYSSNANVTHSVSVNISNNVCSASKNISVQRNTSITGRQAEHWYVSTNHPIGSTTAVLNEHVTWHQTNQFNSKTYSGSLFFNFHHQFLSRFNSWRATFGYPQLVSWNPATPYPTGTDIAAPGRNAWTSYPLPLYFTINGSDAPRPQSLFQNRGLACDTLWGQYKLADFPADLNLLGCAVTTPFHNGVHTLAGGGMFNVGTSPRDPLFWRFHTFVDQVAQNRTNLVTTGSNSIVALNANSKLSLIKSGATFSPPQVTYQVPFTLYPNLVQFPTSISVTFSENVTGVRASDLIINGYHATYVKGLGSGPYVFSGFRLPEIGPVQVIIMPDHIAGMFSNPFGGASWNYKLLDQNADDDNDGLSNWQEVMKYHTNPENPDTMMDGIPDGYKVAHSCLDPLVSYAQPEDYNMNPIPGTAPLVLNGHGISVIQEYQMGINPCK